MKIKEYLKANESVPIEIENVPFPCYCVFVSGEEEKDIKEGLPYDGANGPQMLTFLERLELAKEEIADEVTELLSDQSESLLETPLSRLYRFFRANTEKGNVHYWGGFLAVFTDVPDKEIDAADNLTFGVRMD